MAAIIQFDQHAGVGQFEKIGIKFLSNFNLCNPKEWELFLKKTYPRIHQKLQITGNDVTELRSELEGAEIGRVLKTLQHQVWDEELPNDKELLREKVREI